MSRIRFIWKYTARYNIKLFIALICLTFVSAANLVYPWLFKFMVDRFTDKSAHVVSFTTFIFILAGVFLLSTVLGYYAHVIMQELGSRLRNDIRIDFYSAIYSMPYSFYRTINVGDITSRATDDIGKIQTVFSSLVVTIYQNALFIMGCIVLMVLLNALAAAVVLALVILPLPILLYYSGKIRNLTAQSQSQHAKANAVMEESLVGIRDVKSFLLEKFRLAAFSSKEEEALGNEIRAAKYHSKSNQVIYIILSAALLAIFYFSQSGSVFLTAGDSVAFFFYAYSLTMSFISIGRAYSGYQNIAGSLARIMELFESRPVSKAENLYTGAIKGKVKFNNVTFGYQKESPVLQNLSFNVDEGKWLLVTGPSGSGKSTIANLILGFYTPEEGNIFIGDYPLGDIDEPTLRKNIGYVGQEPVLFEGTIKENILLTQTGTGKERLNNILDICILGDFVSSLPEGVNTNIAERGITLSAGQRSRIAIARALVFDPVILILDEANSMLESDLEQKLWQNLLVERINKTTIIFSHHIENIPRVYTHISLDEAGR